MKMNLIGATLAAAGLLALLGCGDGHDHSTHDHAAPPVKAPVPAVTPAPAPAPAAVADPNAKPYPLKTCIVSGEALGSMGEPLRFTYKGQEIKLCCKGCEKKWQADSDKLLEKIVAAAGK